MALHVFNDDDGVVDHQTGRQRDAKQSKRVDGEAKHLGEDKSANQRDRNRDCGNHGAAPSLQEQKNHDNNNDDGFDQGLQHFLYGVAHSDGGVHGDLVFQSLREVLLQAQHLGDYVALYIERVGVRQLLYDHADYINAVEANLAAVDFRSHLSAAQVAQLVERTI